MMIKYLKSLKIQWVMSYHLGEQSCDITACLNNFKSCVMCLQILWVFDTKINRQDTQILTEVAFAFKF